MRTLAVVSLLLAPTQHRMHAAALAAAVWLPFWLSLAMVGTVIARSRSRLDPFDEVAFHQMTAAELRAGRSLRQALSVACGRTVSLPTDRTQRALDAGQPMDDVAETLHAALPSSGRLTAAAVAIAGTHGGSVAPVFSTLAALQFDELELRRELRASTAAIRASVVVVAALPAVALVGAWLAGRLQGVLALGAPGVVLLVAGMALLVTGGLMVVALGRAAQP